MSAPLSIHHLFCGFFWNFGFLSCLWQPTHHAAQLRAHDFDRMLLLFFAKLVEIRTASFILCNPFLREVAGLDVGENFLHRLPGFIAHDLFAARQISVLCGVRNRVAHAVQSTFVDEVDYEFHLMQALEVGDLRCIPSFDESFESLLNQRCQASAKNCLLAEEIALGFFLESCFENSGACRADAMSICQPE